MYVFLEIKLEWLNGLKRKVEEEKGLAKVFRALLKDNRKEEGDTSGNGGKHP